MSAPAQKGSPLSWYNKYTSPYTWFNNCPKGSALAGYDAEDGYVCKSADGKLHRQMADNAEYTFGMKRKSCQKRHMVWIPKNKHSKGYCRKHNSAGKRKSVRRSARK